MTITEALTIIGIPVIRSVAGWAQSSLEDKQIEAFEWGKLGETIIRVGVPATAIYLGLNAVGIDIPALATGAGVFVGDLIARWVSKLVKKE